MSVDASQVQVAFPAYDIDKIAAYSTQFDSYPTSVGVGYSYSIPSNYEQVNYTLETIPNPYGSALLTNLSWSVDSADYYDQDCQLWYYNSTLQQLTLQMGVSCGCSDDTIYFFFQTQYTGTQTVYLQFAVDSPT